MSSACQLGQNCLENPEKFGNKQSINGKVPIKYISDYPSYLKPHRHYPYRRIDDTHVENVMKAAIEKYENSLRQLEDERLSDAQNLKGQLEDNKKYVEMLE
jgi:hypothetical protein